MNTTFTNVNNEDNMYEQNFFTSTQSQFENSGYQPDVSLGLTDMSEILLPTFKIGKEIGATTNTIVPIVVKKTDGIYDDVTLGTINQINNISPTVGNVLLDTRVVLPTIGGIESLDGYYGGSSPSINLGTFFNGVNALGNEP